MAISLPVIALVGRTNVGKSTLFNALLGRRVAIVEPTPGVTRDRTYSLVTRYSFFFTLCDTGGIVGDADEDLQSEVREQTEIAIEESDLLLVVLDGVEGVTALDREVVAIVRRSGKPALWVINKCEKDVTKESAAQFYELGISDFSRVSAAHREGIRELVESISETLASIRSLSTARPEEDTSLVRVAFVGTPNVGKSTLINRIVGKERLVASAIPGTTRDSIDVPLVREGRSFTLIDTAGLRRKARVEDGTVERFSTLRTLRSIVRADVVVLVLSGELGAPSAQEVKIATLAHERGKGLIIVINKWDVVEKDHRTVHAYEEMVFQHLTFARYAPLLFVSALTGRRCPHILSKAVEVVDAARVRIKTSDVNEVLRAAFLKHPPPRVRGDSVKLRFATQVHTTPPTFVVFLSRTWRVPPSYARYLKTALRDHFPYPGLDIKLEFRRAREGETSTSS
jgi:GTPase